MMEFDDSEIAAEAYRLWEADGSPLWGHPHDHWFRAIESLRARTNSAAGPEGAVPTVNPPDAPQAAPDARS